MMGHFAIPEHEICHPLAMLAMANEYVGLCAEFPSLSWPAPTPQGVLKGIRRVVAEVMKDYA